MPTILFWNVNQKDLLHHVCNAVIDVSADVAILIENPCDIRDSLKTLRSNVSTNFSIPQHTIGRFHLFSRSPGLDLTQIHSENRLSIRRLAIQGQELMLGIVHLVDQQNWDAQHQVVQSTLIASRLREVEGSQNHSRTILVGDFNMNPYDPAMNMAEGFNAMMTKACAKETPAVNQGSSYQFFYNPMWNFFGDETQGPAGTYYFRNRCRGVFGWNMLDQVLVRPSAITHFESVSILTKAGDTSLAKEKTGWPNEKVASDHFPLVLRLR